MGTCLMDLINVIREGKPGPIALTFDDGPSIHTPRLLDALRRHGIKATFFLVGERVEPYREIVQRISNEGHTIGNHSFSHRNLTLMTEKEIRESLWKTNDVIERTTLRRVTIMRPPGGNCNRKVVAAAKEEAMSLIFWNKDPMDWKYRDKEVVKNFLLGEVKKGDIVLLHDLYETTVDGVIEALPIMIERGFDFFRLNPLGMRAGEIYPSGWKVMKNL